MSYQAFLKYSVQPQKQPGYSYVDLRVPRGEISAQSLKNIAQLERKFPGLEFRTSTGQNLQICRVKNEDLSELFKALLTILGENFLYAGTLLDLIACKGAQTCNLGICNSPALAAELEKMIAAEFTGQEVFARLGIRLNGCPNACARHPVGKISFYGLVKRINDRPVPFYKLLLGSRLENGEAKLAEEIGQLPAKSVPAFLREFLKLAEEKLQSGVKTNDYLAGEGKTDAAGLLAKYADVKDHDFYIDWGRTEEFSLAGIGPGECGAGVIDLIEADLKEAKEALDKGDHYRAMILAARALLIVKGSEPTTDSEVLAEFKRNLVEAGVIDSRFKEITESDAGELYAAVVSAYNNMDSNFNFPVKETVVVKAGQEALMDLRGVKCPLNYVKAKLRLETMALGEELLLYLDPGEPIENVPASLKNDGQAVLKIAEKNGYFEVLVKREA